MIVTIYRVQDRDGRGPWKPGFSHRWIEDRPDLDNLPPWFEEFGRVDRCAPAGASIGSGCRTLEQLRRWFTPIEYLTILRFGYQAIGMEVDCILAESDIQCVFARRKLLKQDVVPVSLYQSEGATHE